jgi:hypothetical protein
MGLGQTMLTIMALMLMGRTILNMSTATLNTGYTKDMAEYRIIATSLGTSMIEITSTLAFDESTAVPEDTTLSARTASSPAELCAPGILGLDPGETIATADDIDDYNNYIKLDTLQSIPYRSRVKVQYVDTASTTLAPINSRTFSKKLSVFVTSPFMVDYSRPDHSRHDSLGVPDTVVFQTVYSYWFFR